MLLPYCKAKLDGLYAHYSSAQRGGVLGLALSARRQQQQQQQAAAASDANGPPSEGHQWRQRLAAALQRGGVAGLLLLYPYVHAGIEGLRFVYQLGYLLDVLDCHSPVLQALQQRLVRLSGQEMVSWRRPV